MSASVQIPFDRLLARARAEGPAGLGPLLECYRAYLTILSRVQIGQRLQGKADAADLVQETFLEAHRAFPRFRGHTQPEFTRWLRRILATSLAHLVRRYRGTQGRDILLERRLSDELGRSSAALDAALAARQSTPSQQVERREQAVILANALCRLSEDYREVLVLRHLEGLTFPEIARRMARTVDSAEKLWARALARLRQALSA